MRPLLVILTLTLLLLARPAEAGQQIEVTGLTLSAAGAGPELLIELSGTAAFFDFPLSDPARIVIDVQGAREALRLNRFEVRRGGINSIRSSQFTAEVVRVVIDLDRSTTYSVSSVPGGILLRLPEVESAFEGWSSRDALPAAVSSVYADAGANGAGNRSTGLNGSGAMAPPPGQDNAAGGSVFSASSRPQERQRITVSFHEEDIRYVLASFAAFTGRSIVPGAGVANISVTATIRDQPWDVALYTILNAYGLAARELSSGIVQIDSIERLQERQVLEPLVTETFRINYIPVAEVAASVEPMLSERGRISVTTTTNTLIVNDAQSVLNAIRTILTQLDIRTPQVSIQAKIIFVNRTDVEELGVTYDLKDSQGSAMNRLVAISDPFDPGNFTNTDVIRLGGSSIAGLGNANIRVQQPQLEAVLSLVLGRHTLIAFIDALQSQELSDVQAAPLITTLDNQPAEIWVGERTPIRVVDVGTPGMAGPGTQAPRATAELVETGIRLRVTPTITADRRILMQLHAERSSAQLAATDIGVIFQQQQGTTRLMVEDGETAVIGGLTVTEIAQTRAGIPVLMDLPVIGALFRTTRSREQKRDLLIMVTPRIVEDRP